MYREAWFLSHDSTASELNLVAKEYSVLFVMTHEYFLSFFLLLPLTYITHLIFVNVNFFIGHTAHTLCVWQFFNENFN